jgi:hypothetical protein
LDQEELIKTNAGITVSKSRDGLSRETAGLGNQIDDHKIVADSVHFAEMKQVQRSMLRG